MTASAADPFVHPALFYRDQETYLAGTVPFIGAGLSAGEPVAVAVPAARLGLLRNALGGRADQVRLIDMEEAGRNPGRIIPGVLRAFADAHPGKRVRIIGEPIWAARDQDEYPACVQHEALINHAFTGQRATILCPYDTSALDERVIADAYATHPVLIEDSAERASDGYAPDRVIADYNRPLPHAPGAAAFSFDAERLPDVRRFATDRAAALGLPRERTDDLALAVAELTTNSVLHGGGTGTLRIWAADGRIVCEVADRGHLADPLAGRRPARPGQPGGRGLLLVNHVSDLVRLHATEEGTTVRIHLTRRRP
ncbi:sensor histidine kinase [Actinacidiphila paucisporea]|uniref:Anti-sigma regulatory factor (Ser/Thr protein kinase) n=1 Tax=Actinacidiphila paucisporea TaxID=310782 RepID=A0A1M7QAH0_9ACTN|nr:sensor histidine kinase [Actinacidiphila paucisporea]SHN27736.1 Anti-sigma regulatory factor (Ser/Thr protein kinase) [Actinacidiphila paucisporea]